MSEIENAVMARRELSCSITYFAMMHAHEDLSLHIYSSAFFWRLTDSSLRLLSSTLGVLYTCNATFYRSFRIIKLNFFSILLYSPILEFADNRATIGPLIPVKNRSLSERCTRGT